MCCSGWLHLHCQHHHRTSCLQILVHSGIIPIPYFRFYMLLLVLALFPVCCLYDFFSHLMFLQCVDSLSTTTLYLVSHIGMFWPTINLILCDTNMLYFRFDVSWLVLLLYVISTMIFFSHLCIYSALISLSTQWPMVCVS